MIFDTVNSSAINWDAVKESAYPVGLEGGLMHVYENECNFNAIMKAAGISELKYYKECGGDLFVTEAAATGGFIDKFISFFKKVGEKIAQMFKKFVMTIGSFVQSDKNFVKKWKPQVFKNFKEFDFKGYTKLTGLSEKVSYDEDDYKLENETLDPAQLAVAPPNKNYSEDELSDKRKEIMKNICDEEVDDESEFKKALHKIFYGENGKEEFKVTSTLCSKSFELISNAEKNIKSCKTIQTKINNNINSYCNKLEKAKDILVKNISSNNEMQNKNDSAKIIAINQAISLAKDKAQYMTMLYSITIGAYKDANRQAKAICVKALNSGSKKKDATADEVGKNESAADIFADVEII